jgi:hypothetical protein
MANCTNCGQPLDKGLKFCPSCGTAVKSGTAKNDSFTKTVAVAEGAGMGKIAIIAVTAACAVIVLFFFFTFFAVSIGTSGSNSYLSAYLSSSLDDTDTSISGIGTAFGGSDSATGSGKPSLLLVWLLAIAMLVALYVPKVREKLESVQLPTINIPVIGGLSIFAYLSIIIAFIGLIVFIGVYSSTIGYAKREMAGMDVYLSMLGASISFHTGIGFKMTVFALLVLLGTPFADKYFLSKRA